MSKIMKKISKLTITSKVCIFIIIVMILIGIFSNIISIQPYNVPSGQALEPPSKIHWLGTDDIGIDIWAQICYGAKISITIGLISAVLAGVGGSIIGIFSGYFGGLLDKIIMRIIDMIIIIPNLPMMIVLGAFLGPSIKNIVVILVLFSWTTPARIVRSKILSIKQEKYILVAKSYGANFIHLTRKHFLPSIMPIMMVSVIKLISKAIVAEASMAFLGLGDPTTKSWGLILNHAIGFKGIYYTDYWKWWVISPLTAIILLVVSIAFISRELEKIVNKKL
ncbi:ABC transporter permease [Clostridium sp. UBA4395]|uniref:ABC transporter permease n=1 Tax=Clostridium sp. UBA4395 TaxID=1946360 RepID=UPI003216C0E5